MANTYELITGITGQGNPYTVPSGGIDSVIFSDIPATYTDLKIVASIRSERADTDDTFRIDFNAYAGTNLSSKRLEGNGSSASSATDASNISFRTGAGSNTASVFGNTEIYIPNYASANHKSVSIDNVTEHMNTQAWASLSAGLWANTAAITSIRLISANSADSAEFSTFALYGIKKD